MKPIIAIASDHAGFLLKEEVKNYLMSVDYSVEDFGTDSEDSVDYPDFVHPLCEKVNDDEGIKGILICGSANGVAITANKHLHIRAGIAWNKEISKLMRQHNNANIICLPSRFISKDSALELVDAFLNTDFEAGRHERRVNKISSPLNC